MGSDKFLAKIHAKVHAEGIVAMTMLHGVGGDLERKIFVIADRIGIWRKFRIFPNVWYVQVGDDDVHYRFRRERDTIQFLEEIYLGGSTPD